MSESLTTDRLAEIEACAKNYYPSDYLSDSDVASLISMARRYLSAEERLEKAARVMTEIKSQLRAWKIAEEKLDVAGISSGVNSFVSEICRLQTKISEVLLGTPKELRPPQECAPSAEPDDSPVSCLTYFDRGGWEVYNGDKEGWNPCPDCSQ
jgi:hypothetical protein